MIRGEINQGRWNIEEDRNGETVINRMSINEGKCDLLGGGRSKREVCLNDHLEVSSNAPQLCSLFLNPIDKYWVVSVRESVPYTNVTHFRQSVEFIHDAC